MTLDGESAFLFQETHLAGPLEELRSTVEKKTRMHLSLGETAAAARLDLAYQIARQALESALVTPQLALRAPSAEGIESSLGVPNPSSCEPERPEALLGQDPSPAGSSGEVLPPGSNGGRPAASRASEAEERT